MKVSDLKVGALYEPYSSRNSFIVKLGYLKTIPGSRRGKRFLIYLGEADPSETPYNRRHYFWVFVGNRKCLMHQDRLRAIKPVEET